MKNFRGLSAKCAGRLATACVNTDGSGDVIATWLHVTGAVHHAGGGPACVGRWTKFTVHGGPVITLKGYDLIYTAPVRFNGSG